MLPWNYGFHWTLGTIIFMGAFYAVLTTVIVTLTLALLRSTRALRAREAELIRWESDFHDLPARDRDCRHVISGEFKHRECPNGFDCRGCETHAMFAVARDNPASGATQPSAREEMMGLRFPLDRAYHRGHAWVRREPDKTLVVGLDDLGRRLIGEPDSVELPKPGERVVVNGTAWLLHKGKSQIRILSPIDGVVVETGGPAARWYLRVKPDRFDLRHLLCGPEIRPWLIKELERLQMALTAEGAAPTLADGGVLMEDITATCPAADWDAVYGEMFLNP